MSFGGLPRDTLFMLNIIRRIYKPSKAATQSSNWPGQRRKMDWNVLPSRGNWYVFYVRLFSGVIH